MKPVRFGMIGGGEGAFIGAVHRTAMRLDGRGERVAGALSSDEDRALASAKAIGIPRGYASVEAMLEAEAALPESKRIEAVSIVTPNFTHAGLATACLEAGFHVVLDKPMAVTSEECAAIAAAAGKTGKTVTITYNYSGYPLVREARALVESGAIGAVRRVQAEYVQGWLATDLEASGHKQAAWRTDPARAGAGALGDIATHAEHLAAFVTGLRPSEVLADVSSFVEGRRVDDDASVLLRYDTGARGSITASQVCVGEENGLSLRVFGETGSLTWKQEQPNALEVRGRRSRAGWRRRKRQGCRRGRRRGIRKASMMRSRTSIAGRSIGSAALTRCTRGWPPPLRMVRMGWPLSRRALRARALG